MPALASSLPPYPPPPPSPPSRRKHPVALAFQKITTNTMSSITATTKGASDKVRSRIMELSWRQKFSLEDVYPCSFTVPGSHPTIDFRIEQTQMGEQRGGGTGGVVWNASHVLAAFLCREAREGRAHLAENCRVCDLGCGAGLGGLVAAALAREGEVTFADVGPVLDLARRNIEENRDRNGNNITAACAVREYWWGSGSLGAGLFDVVLVADCILPKLYPIPPLVAAIAELLTPFGKCFVSYEHRTWFEFDPREEFRRVCGERGMVVERVEEGRMDEVYRGEDVEVWVVTRRGGGREEGGGGGGELRRGESG